MNEQNYNNKDKGNNQPDLTVVKGDQIVFWKSLFIFDGAPHQVETS